MGISELKKYSEYAKPIEQNDITKANTLIENGKYADILGYMLKNGIKLEQEIVGYLEIPDNLHHSW